jgi:hypothetical protein
VDSLLQQTNLDLSPLKLGEGKQFMILMIDKKSRNYPVSLKIGKYENELHKPP